MNGASRPARDRLLGGLRLRSANERPIFTATLARKGRKMALVKVGRAGKITLPAALRRQLEIVEGEDLEAEVVEGGLLLRRATEAERKKAWRRIREAQRSVRYVGPEPRPQPEDEERMIFEEVGRLRHGDA